MASIWLALITCLCFTYISFHSNHTPINDHSFFGHEETEIQIKCPQSCLNGIQTLVSLIPKHVFFLCDTRGIQAEYLK